MCLQLQLLCALSKIIISNNYHSYEYGDMWQVYFFTPIRIQENFNALCVWQLYILIRYIRIRTNIFDIVIMKINLVLAINIIIVFMVVSGMFFHPWFLP